MKQPRLLWFKLRDLLSQHVCTAILAFALVGPLESRVPFPNLERCSYDSRPFSCLALAAQMLRP